MPPQPDFRRFWVPLVGLLWGVCMTLAALISRVQDFSSQLAFFPLRSYLLLALPGFALTAGWLLMRLVK